MGRFILVLLLLAVSGIIFLVKAGARKVTGREIGGFQDESRRVMQKTAQGINWMNEQWELAKHGHSSGNSGSKAFSSKSATEIIATIKANSTQYPHEKAQSTYIKAAVDKMKNRQFDDAEKLVMQLQAGEARDYMLMEIEEKRKM